MILNAREAIEKTIEVWEFVIKTGEPKESWPDWEQNGGEYVSILNRCFLCEYDLQAGYGILKTLRNAKTDNCDYCPYFIHYRIDCLNRKNPFRRYTNARTDGTRKRNAKQIVKDLKALLL